MGDAARWEDDMCGTVLPHDVVAEARKRWWVDPPFHAQVENAVQLLYQDEREGAGRRMTDDDMALARTAAAVALHVCDKEADRG